MEEGNVSSSEGASVRSKGRTSRSDVCTTSSGGSGDQFGEMTVMLQNLFQGFNCHGEENIKIS